MHCYEKKNHFYIEYGQAGIFHFSDGCAAFFNDKNHALFFLLAILGQRLDVSTTVIAATHTIVSLP